MGDYPSTYNYGNIKMSKENLSDIELENRSVMNAIASILSLQPTQINDMLLVQSESFKEVKNVLNDLLNEGISDKWRRTLSFELKADYLDQASLENASAQFDNSLNPNNFSDIARNNYKKRLSILKKFEDKISKEEKILKIIEDESAVHTLENGVYKLTLQIENQFNYLYHQYESDEMDWMESQNPDAENLILDLNQMMQVIDSAYASLFNYIEKNKVINNEDSIWGKLIINSSINRSIIEFDEFYRISYEVNSLIEKMFDDINFNLNFSLPEDIFVEQMFNNLSMGEGFSKEKIVYQVEDFLEAYFKFQRQSKIGPDFEKIHGSLENKNLVNLIFIWLAYSGVKINNRILGDTNSTRKIVTSRQQSLKEVRSTNIYYIIRRLYDTLFYSTQLKQELFKKNNILEYQEVIAYKRAKIRQILVSMKFFNLGTLNRLSANFSK